MKNIMIDSDEYPPATYLQASVQDARAFYQWSITAFHKKPYHLVVLFMLVGSIVTYYAHHTVFAAQKEHVVTVTSHRQDGPCLFRTQLHSNTLQQFTQTQQDCVQAEHARQQQQQRKEHFHALLAGYPMEKMADALADEDEQVAAFIIGIGKIESNWGKHSPWKAGRDCYNYWGYKTTGSRGQALGHACFGSPEEAVETIAKRLDHFVIDQGRDTPQKLLVWKCGRSCASHDPAGVARWVGTVGRYAQQARTMQQQIAQTSDSAVLAMQL